MMNTGTYYPPVGFQFLVSFRGLIDSSLDCRFQSVSGLSVEYEMETFKEGGENRFEHKLPVRTKYTDLVLKRGHLVNSALIKWCLDAFEKRQIEPVTVVVTLLNEHHAPLKTWMIYNAWPKKWSVSDFNAQENSLVIDTLELCYSNFKIL